MNRKTLSIVIVLAIAFASGTLAGVWRHQLTAIRSAIVYPTPRALPVVELSDHLGQGLTAARFVAGWDILFFGFTHCPDICPTTLYQLGQLQEQLADLEAARRPRIWLVTVDPERDTASVLANYLAAFGPQFSGITGQPEQIAQFAAGLGVAYQQSPEGDSYTMSHTAALFLIDPAADLTAIFTAPHDISDIARDYRILTR